ncbi:MAG: DNA/RNA nuclease SfsA [Kofleriaceae bacterium]
MAAGAVDEAAGYPELGREVPFGASRLDFCLRRGSRRKDELWIEVKTATMSVGDGVVAFPDAVTTRGRRHLDELLALRRRGARAMLLFCVARTDARTVRPADEIDPAYGEALRRAVAGGVEVVARACTIDDAGLALGQALPVDLG